MPTFHVSNAPTMPPDMSTRQVSQTGLWTRSHKISPSGPQRRDRNRRPRSLYQLRPSGRLTGSIQIRVVVIRALDRRLLLDHQWLWVRAEFLDPLLLSRQHADEIELVAVLLVDLVTPFPRLAVLEPEDASCGVRRI